MLSSWFSSVVVTVVLLPWLAHCDDIPLNLVLGAHGLNVTFEPGDLRPVNPDLIPKLPQKIINDATALASQWPQALPGFYQTWPATEEDFPGVVTLEGDAECLNPPPDGSLLEAFANAITTAWGIWEFPLAFTGSLIDADSNVHFVFRMVAIPGGSTDAQFRAGSELTANDLKNIYDTKAAIIQRTTPTNLLVFVGNTAAYFYYAFGPSDGRQTALIPLSGHAYSYGSPSTEAIDAYVSSILQPAFSVPFDRLVFIDHTRTGNSIDDLVTLLDATGVYKTPSGKPSLINLIYSTSYKNIIMRAFGAEYLEPIQVGTQDSDMAKFDLGYVGRLLPSYPRECWVFNWETVPFGDSARAAALRSKIQANSLMTDSPPAT